MTSEVSQAAWGLLVAEKQFRRVQGYKQIPTLIRIVIPESE
jgi:hypothetical protein